MHRLMIVTQSHLPQFSKLFGKVTTNKNDVVKNASWQFTGNRNAR